MNDWVPWQFERVYASDRARQRNRGRVGRRLRSRVPARTNEMMLIPIDAYAAVVQAFVAAVERDVLPDAISVLADEMFHPRKRGFFFDGEDKDQIGFRLDTCFVESADRCENRFDVASIVADSGSVNLAVPNLGFDLQTRLKDRVEVSIEDYRFCSPSALANSNEIAFRVVVNLVELARFKCFADCFGALVLFA